MCTGDALTLDTSKLLRSLSYESEIEKVPRGIQGKRREKLRQLQQNWSQQLEHKQVLKRGTEPGFSVSCWLATPVANAPWKPLVIQ